MTDEGFAALNHFEDVMQVSFGGVRNFSKRMQHQMKRGTCGIMNTGSGPGGPMDFS